MKSPLDFPCTVCSAPIGSPCVDKTRGYVECEPHWGRRLLAGEEWPSSLG